jgi:hypothetical protein
MYEEGTGIIPVMRQGVTGTRIAQIGRKALPTFFNFYPARSPA